MKKIIISITVILAVFLSLGFIVLKKPANDTVTLEQVSNHKTDADLAVIQETNDEQWN